MEDGSFVTSDAIREAANKLNDVLKAMSEGSFKLDREKDELTYALGTPEHTGRVRGMGVVPWKHGFSGDIETYRSRHRRKAEVAKKMRALEERVASIEGALATSQQQPPEARSMAQLEPSPVGSQRRICVASTEHPAADQEDDITVRTPCELLYQLRKKLKVVAHGVAEVLVQDGSIHGMMIPEGYARVIVDRVEKGCEDLDLEIPGGNGEEELGQAHHTLIC